MLMLRPEASEGKKVKIWNSQYIERKFSGVGFAFRWQNVYRDLERFYFGTHKPDESKALSDIGYGLSINISGLHLFIGLLYESHYIRLSQTGREIEEEN